MTTAHIPVGVEVERRGAGPDWIILRLRPGTRRLAPWTALAEAEGVTRFYAGTARLTLRAAEARRYAALLATEAPALIVVLARAEAEPGWTLRSVSLGPEPEDSPAESLRAALPIPASLRAWITDFATHHAGATPEPAPLPEPPQSFLDRWSRRKRREARPGPPAAAPAAAAPDIPAPDLPPLESLRTRADYAAYLRAGAPPALRLAALRQAWASDPAIAGHKPLVDYDWNFNAPGYGRLLPADNSAKLVESLFGHLRRRLAPEEAPPAPEPPIPEPPAVTEANRAADAPVSDPGPEPTASDAPPRRHGGTAPT